MSALILKLTDGTTTLDLNDMTNYGIPDQEWTPAIAPRRRAQIGGIPFDDVVESIPLHVRGATGAAALANVAALANFLDQAERFSLGENVSPVRLLYRSINSTLTNPVEALVLSAGNNMLQLSPQLNAAGNHEIPGINLRVKRRGLWLNSTPATASSSTSSGNPAVVSTAFGSSAAIQSPVSLSIEMTSLPLTTTPYDRLSVVITNDPDNVEIIEAESLTKRDSTGGAVTNVAETNARGGYVKRFNGSNGGYYDTSVNNAKRISAIIVARNNSTTDGAFVNLQAASVSWGAFSNGGTVSIDASTTNPRIFILPTVALPTTISRICVNVSAASLDIDYIMLINMDSHETRVLASFAATSDQVGVKTWFQQQPLSDITPLIKNTNSAGSQTEYAPWAGNRHVYLSGDTLAVGVVGLNDTGYWQLVDAGSVVSNFKLDDVSRLQACLVPG